MEVKLIEWFTKHFGHVLTGRADTAEHARAVKAYDELIKLANAPDETFSSEALTQATEEFIQVKKGKKVKIPQEPEALVDEIKTSDPKSSL